MPPLTFDLFGLPRELRDHIYEYHIAAEKTVLVQDTATQPPRYKFEPYTTLLVSKQFKYEYNEALQRTAIRHHVCHVELITNGILEGDLFPDVSDQSSIVLRVQLKAPHMSIAHEKDGYWSWHRYYEEFSHDSLVRIKEQAEKYTGATEIAIELSTHTHRDLRVRYSSRSSTLICLERALQHGLELNPALTRYSVRSHRYEGSWGERDGVRCEWSQYLVPSGWACCRRDRDECEAECSKPEKYGQFMRSMGLDHSPQVKEPYGKNLEENEDVNERYWVGGPSAGPFGSPDLTMARVTVGRHHQWAEEGALMLRQARGFVLPGAVI